MIICYRLWLETLIITENLIQTHMMMLKGCRRSANMTSLILKICYINLFPTQQKIVSPIIKTISAINANAKIAGINKIAIFIL